MVRSKQPEYIFGGVAGRPVHDENNHGVDAPRGPAVCTDKITNKVSDKPHC